MTELTKAQDEPTENNGYKAPVVFDTDGLLIDDINKRIDHVFPRVKSLLRNAVVEFTFAAMHLAPRYASKQLVSKQDSKHEKSEPIFVPEAINLMKGLQRRGNTLLVCTANFSNNIRIIAEGLRQKGIEAETRYLSTLGKAAIFANGKYILIEDDPWVALNVARKGIDVVLLKKQYSIFTTPIARKINRRIHVARNWGEIRDITERLVESIEHGMNYASKSGTIAATA